MGLLSRTTHHFSEYLVSKLLLIPATQRLSKLIVDDFITEPLRNAVWKRFDPFESKIGYLIRCHWCTSMWTGTVLTLLHYTSPKTSEAVNLILTASLVTGYLEQWRIDKEQEKESNQ